MSATSEIPLPPPEEVRRAARKRGCLTALIVFVVLIPCFYWLENCRGRSAMEGITAEYEADGESLDPRKVFTPSVPDHENFGATPLLDGIMVPEDGEWAAARAAVAKRARLLALLPNRPTMPHTGGKAPLWPLLDAPVVNWNQWREMLTASATFTPPADEPDDARAVYLALDKEKALFDELIAAARRPHAVFTPSPAERSAGSASQQMTHWAHDWLLRLTRVVALRFRAAVADHRLDEAASVAAIVLSTVRASAEESLLGVLAASTVATFWVAGVRDILRAPARNDDLLAQLQTQAAKWDFEFRVLHAFRMEAVWSAHRWKEIRDAGIDGDGNVVVRFAPPGWLLQNGVRNLRLLKDFAIKPLRDGGCPSFKSACEAWNAEMSRTWSQWAPYSTLIAGLHGYDKLMHKLAHKNMRFRLTLLAIGMERYRLRHGRYPANTAAMVPDTFPELPRDLDGAPLRIFTAPDGGKAVIYSIGWDFKDDSHGTPAAGSTEHNETSPDWALELPLPP